MLTMPVNVSFGVFKASVRSLLKTVPRKMLFERNLEISDRDAKRF